MAQVALWEQKASRDETSGHVVVWDYHVILALRRGETEAGDSGGEEGTRCWIYDQDSRLSMPCSAEAQAASQEYFARTFLQQELLEERWRSWFRVVPAQRFLDYFASDRSHMLRGDPGEAAAPGVGLPEYIAPPPEYAPIVGIAAREMGVRTNLMSEFVAMDRGGHGIVVRSVEDALDVVAGGSALRSEWAE
ncbi:hypothetical protein AURDEDRAFT_157451 [Auricularia subglabra TFB-10046 SS5]|nr:hypothetical protein AURDEDRAFT_157451 [Auricularia subglabra TFB-10046 SS5]